MSNLSNEHVTNERLEEYLDKRMCNVTEEFRIIVRELLAYREAAGKPVAHIFQHPQGKLFWAISDDGNAGSPGVIPVYAAPQLSPANSPEIPDGWALVPRKLTAENGAKSALLGDFLETKYISCPECFGDEECESCDGSGRIKVDVTVSWDTIKRIYSSAIDLFCKEGSTLAAAPKPGGDNG